MANAHLDYYINAADAGSSSGSTGYSIQIKPNSKPVPMSMSFFGIGLDVSVNAMLDLFNDVSSKLSSNPSLVSYFQAFPASELNLLDLIISSPDTVGINVRLGSRLLDKKAVTDQAGMAKILPLYARTQLQGIFTTGPGVRAVPVNENAVNPAWRKAYLHSSMYPNNPHLHSLSPFPCSTLKRSPLLPTHSPFAAYQDKENTKSKLTP